MRFGLLVAVNMNLRNVVSCRLRTFVEVTNRQQTYCLPSPGQNTGSKTLVHIYQITGYISTKLRGTYPPNYTVYIQQITRYIYTKLHGIYIHQITRYISTKLHGIYVPNYMVHTYQITRYISTKVHGIYLPNFTVHIYQNTR